MNQFINEKELLSYCGEINIAQHFIGKEIKIGSAMISPFRDETRPSFGFYWHRNNRKLWWKDHSLGIHGNVVDLVKHLFNTEYYIALNLIAKEFCFGIEISEQKVKLHTEFFTKKIEYNVIADNECFDYYFNYGLSEHTLKKFDIKHIVSVYNKSYSKYSYIRNNNYCYGYRANDKWKFNLINGHVRFFGNADKDTIQGLEQLEYKSDILIITKSIKDVMVLNQCGYESIAFQSEILTPSKEIVDFVYDKYSNVFLLYDNDSAGIKGSEIICNEYNFIPIFVPLTSKCKDISDVSKMYGINIAKKWLNRIL